MEASFETAWAKAVKSFISKQTNILCYNIEELGELSTVSGSNTSLSEESIDAPSTDDIIRSCAYDAANNIQDPDLESKIYNLLKITAPYIINSYDTIFNTCTIILDPDSNNTELSNSMQDSENMSAEQISDND